MHCKRKWSALGIWCRNVGTGRLFTKNMWRNHTQLCEDSRSLRVISSHSRKKNKKSNPLALTKHISKTHEKHLPNSEIAQQLSQPSITWVFCSTRMQMATGQSSHTGGACAVDKQVCKHTADNQGHTEGDEKENDKRRERRVSEKKKMSRERERTASQLRLPCAATTRFHFSHVSFSLASLHDALWLPQA